MNDGEIYGTLIGMFLEKDRITDFTAQYKHASAERQRRSAVRLASAWQLPVLINH
jgi:hypothetical protein